MLRVLTDNNVDDICNVTRKPGSKNADKMTNRGQQVLVIAQENLKLAVFLIEVDEPLIRKYESMRGHGMSARWPEEAQR